ncbi:hypothetical protein HK102_008417 [Quaeritorhiza haematococci]|nr:hypothetical protein HK102_008417 [Quaeritorhiza haematococci]
MSTPITPTSPTSPTSPRASGARTIGTTPLPMELLPRILAHLVDLQDSTNPTENDEEELSTFAHEYDEYHETYEDDYEESNTHTGSTAEGKGVATATGTQAGSSSSPFAPTGTPTPRAPPNALVSCLTVSSDFFLAACPLLYRSLRFSKASNRRLQKLVDTLTLTDANYERHIRELHFQHMTVDAPERTRYQSWELVREVIARAAPYLEGLTLGAIDDAFLLDSPPQMVPVSPIAGGLGPAGMYGAHGEAGGMDSGFGSRENLAESGAMVGAAVNRNLQTWFPPTLAFPHLKRLAVTRGCRKFSTKFIIDLLRRCPKGSLQAISLPRCLSSLDGTGWWLLGERGGNALEVLEISAAYDSTWDHEVMEFGLEQLGRMCPNLRKLDVSHHVDQISPELLGKLLDTLPSLESLHLRDCGIRDPHIMAIVEKNPTKLRDLGLSSTAETYIVDKDLVSPVTSTAPSSSWFPWRRKSVVASVQASIGDNRHALPYSSPNGNFSAAYNILTDRMCRTLLDKVFAGKGARVEMPRRLINVGTGTLEPTGVWAAALPTAKLIMDGDEDDIKAIDTAATKKGKPKLLTEAGRIVRHSTDVTFSYLNIRVVVPAARSM